MISSVPNPNSLGMLERAQPCLVVTSPTNSSSALVRDQLIRALELDIVGPTPGLLAQLEAEGQSEKQPIRWVSFSPAHPSDE